MGTPVSVLAPVKLVVLMFGWNKTGTIIPSSSRGVRYISKKIHELHMLRCMKIDPDVAHVVTWGASTFHCPRSCDGDRVE